MFSFLKRSHKPSPPARKSSAVRFRPTLEALETRDLLSATTFAQTALALYNGTGDHNLADIAYMLRGATNDPAVITQALLQSGIPGVTDQSVANAVYAGVTGNFAQTALALYNGTGDHNLADIAYMLRGATNDPAVITQALLQSGIPGVTDQSVANAVYAGVTGNFAQTALALYNGTGDHNLADIAYMLRGATNDPAVITQALLQSGIPGVTDQSVANAVYIGVTGNPPVTASDGSIWYLGTSAVDGAGDHAIYHLSNGQVTSTTAFATNLYSASGTIWAVDASGQIQFLGDPSASDGVCGLTLTGSVLKTTWVRVRDVVETNVLYPIVSGFLQSTGLSKKYMELNYTPEWRNPGGYAGDPVYYVNGMLTPVDAARAEADALSNQLQRPVYLLYNGGDPGMAVSNYSWDVYRYQDDAPTKELAGILYKAAQQGANISIVSESQGNLTVRNALRTMKLFGMDGWATQSVKWVSTGSPISSADSVGIPAAHHAYLLHGYYGDTNPPDPIAPLAMATNPFEVMAAIPVVLLNAAVEGATWHMFSSYVGQITPSMVWPSTTLVSGVAQVGTVAIDTSGTPISVGSSSSGSPTVVSSGPAPNTGVGDIALSV